MLGTREANHPVPRLNVDISVQVASQENHILLEPDVLMTRIDRVAWIVREIENAARFVIPSQDGQSCPLGPHPDPTQGGRDGQPRTERRRKDRTGLWTFPSLAHCLDRGPHAFEGRRHRLVSEGDNRKPIARIAISRHEVEAFRAESEMRLDE